MKPIADAVAVAALLNGLLPALAVAAAAWVLLKVTPRMNAATRHAIWWLVLALAVLLPVGFAIHDAGRVRVPARRERVVRMPDRNGPAELIGPPATVSAPVHRAAQLELREGRWSLWLPILWLGLFAAQLGRLGLSYLRLRGIKRRSRTASAELSASFRAWTAACAIRRPIRLLVSDEVATPMAAGFRHPAVLVPRRLLSEFGQTELDHVLLHELSHLARRDDWSNLVARVVSAAVCFNPAARWALRRIEREREMACDEWVVAATGAPRPYAASLARLFEYCIAKRKEALASGMAGHASHLGERIEILVRRKGPHVRGVSLLRVAGCTALLLALVALVARTPRWVAMAQTSAPAAPARPGAPPTPPASARTPDPHSFLAAVVAAGYGDLSVDEIIELRNTGVSIAYLMGVSRAGWGKLKPREIVDLHNSGVNTDFLRAAGESEIPGLTVRGVIDLQNSGVTAAYVQGLHSAGMGKFTKEQIVDLHNHGVPPGLLAAMADNGFTDVDTREIVEAQDCGLRPSDLREAKNYGPNLTLKQVLKLKQAGVLRHE
jgi:beta-lactamase regulating signal transducer with metallopeptidase domain